LLQRGVDSVKEGHAHCEVCTAKVKGGLDQGFGQTALILDSFQRLVVGGVGQGSSLLKRRLNRVPRFDLVES
jgi:hypothetical protein